MAFPRPALGCLGLLALPRVSSPVKLGRTGLGVLTPPVLLSEGQAYGAVSSQLGS